MLVLYVSTLLGLIAYLHATSQEAGGGDNFKQLFFFQYIIMAVSLVLGFLTQLIGLLIIAYTTMQNMQGSLHKYATLYSEEMDKEERKVLLLSSNNNNEGIQQQQ